jgi:AcrR family transcriptional regulator
MEADRRRPRDGRATRELILTAAARRFAAHAYEAVGLRDIARDVGVDVALVHRAFGSKERLFVEALAHAVKPASAIETLSTGNGAALARRAFEDDPERETVADPLALLVRSVASPDALPLIRSFTAREFIDPLAERLKEPGAARAALIAACLVGIRIFRDVLDLEAMGDGARPRLEPLIAELFDDLLTKSIADV